MPQTDTKTSTTENKNCLISSDGLRTYTRCIQEVLPKINKNYIIVVESPHNSSLFKSDTYNFINYLVQTLYDQNRTQGYIELEYSTIVFDIKLKDSDVYCTANIIYTKSSANLIKWEFYYSGGLIIVTSENKLIRTVDHRFIMPPSDISEMINNADKLTF